MRFLATLLIVIVSVGAFAADEFARYPANAKRVERSVAPDVSKGKARKFRTVLREAAKEPANFNGHYRVTYWGCGTNCIEWAIIDLKSGAVWFAPHAALSCYAPDEPPDTAINGWFETRVDSRLLYLYVCDPPFHGPRTENTREVYVWEGSGLKKLRSEKIE